MTTEDCLLCVQLDWMMDSNTMSELASAKLQGTHWDPELLNPANSKGSIFLELHNAEATTALAQNSE